MEIHGATQAEWDLFSLGLGLTNDLLPVVSNPSAKISPGSKMQALGKTPSKYNRDGQAVGIPNWTTLQSTPEQVDVWSRQPDYGLCVQTREVRALDLDIINAALGQQVLDAILERHPSLPLRIRPGSPKCLLVFRLPGEYSKRVIKCGAAGMIEFLATGQQFVAAGTHPSGVKYDWCGSLDAGIPSFSPEEFEALWVALATRFGTEVSTSNPSKTLVLKQAIESDPVAATLVADGWVKAQERDGRLHIRCPFEHEHTSSSAISATTYFPPNTGGYQFGHFDCKHAHCTQRTDDEFKAGIGLPTLDPFDDFEVLPDTPGSPPKQTEKPARFSVIQSGAFAEHKPPGWIVKGVLPRAELGVIYGSSGSGKTFFILDLVCSIAQGAEWRGNRVKQGNVVYVAAEGAGGLRSRLCALGLHRGVDLATVGLGVIPDAPNLLVVDDVKAVISSVRAFGKTSVIVVDTLAQVIPGGDENSGEDIGKVLKHCRELGKHTGAMVLLVHHSGKDATKGARGWSGLRAACDVEIEVVRVDDDRVATVTKLKDGIDGADMPFKLLPVQIGLDEDGDTVSSCVIEHTADMPRVSAKVKGAPLENLILRTLNEMLGVSEEKIAYNALVVRVVEQMVPPTPNQKADDREKKVKKAIENLQDRGSLQMRKGFISLAESAEGEQLLEARGV